MQLNSWYIKCFLGHGSTSIRSLIFITAVSFSSVSCISNLSGKEQAVLPVVKEHPAFCGRIPSRAVAIADAADSLKVSGSNAGDQDMVLVKGGEFLMGNKEFEDAIPVHKVKLKAYWIDVHEVTNAQFTAFVKATSYITVAERQLNPKDYPGVALEKLVAGSAVFTPPARAVSLDDPMQWWEYKAGANWKHPKGGAGSVEGRGNEPVVQVCYEDAAAYAKWAGKRLPTEAEWEFAARAGAAAGTYYWGNTLKPGGKWAANIFQGTFPVSNTLEDGYKELAPVKSFPPNALGLYDMEGNVWEWCSDLYRPDYYSGSITSDPHGPRDSYDPQDPGVTKHVQRGGSFLCSDQYCDRYKAGSRGKGETSSASNNLGFRCARDL